jgi:chromosomal replication initiator protein
MFDLGIDALWAKITESLRQQVRTPVFETWIKAVEPQSYENGVLVLTMPSEFASGWLAQRYGALIKASLQSVVGHPAEVRLTPAPAPAPVGQSASSSWSVGTTAPASNTEPSPGMSVADNLLPSGPNEYLARLNPKYVFEAFVVGNSNRFAHAACLAVSEMPSRAYNPLFIYGGVGLGKTHLMHAIGHRILQDRPDGRVLYVSAETFTNEVINAIRDDKMVQFRQRYRTIDVLLIDDIQFVAGKERTQEEFFHTFEALHGARKQIVISSDRPPKDIPTLEERLRSRFQWGLITDIQPPDLETRIAIIDKKAQMEGLSVPDEVLQFIASRVDTNIRELEGALIRVIAYASITRAPLTLDVAQEALKDVVSLTRPRPVTIRAIQEEVARHFDLKPEDFQSKRRTRAVAFPRQIAMYLARELTDASLPKIGEEFGGRDHTTVMHAYDKVSRDRQADPALNHLLEDLAKRIKNR